jgi:hypothetical protein
MKRLGRVAIVLVGIALGGCSDNAIRLRFGIEDAARKLQAGPDFREERVSYIPVGGATQGYWLIFFPERRVHAEELVARGMPAETADRIYRELGYVDVGTGSMLVVAQDGERLNFTSYSGKHLVIVRDLIVERRVGRCEILVRKQNETLYVEKVL